MEETTTKRARKVEVELLRGYVPADAEPNRSGGYDKVPAGTILKLPSAEANNVIKTGIATTTANSFGE